MNKKGGINFVLFLFVHFISANAGIMDREVQLRIGALSHSKGNISQAKWDES